MFTVILVFLTLPLCHFAQFTNTTDDVSFSDTFTNTNEDGVTFLIDFLELVTKKK